MTDHESMDDFVSNPEPRIPICFCVDIGETMLKLNKDDGGKLRIDRILDGIGKFCTQLQGEGKIANSVDVAVLGYADKPYLLLDFTNVSAYDMTCKPVVDSSFDTSHPVNMGRGVLEAIDRLNARKKIYKNAAVEYYAPWLVLISDICSSGNSFVSELNEAQEKTTDLVSRNRLVHVSGLISSEYSDVDDLKMRYKELYDVFGGFSEYEDLPLVLNPADEFDKFFTWLGKAVSDGNGGSLDFSAFTDWGNV